MEFGGGAVPGGQWDPGARMPMAERPKGVSWRGSGKADSGTCCASGIF